MLDLDLTAADVMTRDVVTIHPHTSIRYAAKLLAGKHVSGLPVVDEAGALVGMVSEGDLIKWRGAPDERQAWWLDMLAEGFELSPDYLDVVRGERELVRGVMKQDVVTVTETTKLQELARLMDSKSINRLPVVKDGKLVGIVARADLVRALAQS